MDQPTMLVMKGDSVEQQLVYAEVYAPNRPDSDGEYMDAETILKMAHDFSQNLRMDQIDVEHGEEILGGACVVESFIARKGDPDFIEGAWVVGVHITDESLWEAVKSGKINGFSVDALVYKEESEVEIEVPPVVTGKTSNEADHEHQFFVTYDENGTFMGGTTDKVDGHKHAITRGTVTEKSEGHNHRFSSVDTVEIISKSVNGAITLKDAVSRAV